jgi:hypothetical protein
MSISWALKPANSRPREFLASFWRAPDAAEAERAKARGEGWHAALIRLGLRIEPDGGERPVAHVIRQPRDVSLSALTTGVVRAPCPRRRRQIPLKCRAQVKWRGSRGSGGRGAKSMTPSSPCRKRFGYCDWAEVLVDARAASEGVGSVTGLSVSAGSSMKRNSSATLRSKASRAWEGSPRYPAVVAPSRSIT